MQELMKRCLTEATAPVAASVCPDCGSQAVQDHGACRSPAFIESLPPEERCLVDSAAASRLYICQSCGLGFRHPIPDEAALAVLYSSFNEDRWTYSAEDRNAWRHAKDILTRRFAADCDCHVLDVGAFDGSFLQTLPSRWNRAAIEPSAAVGADAYRNIALVDRFLNGPTLAWQGKFNAVTLFDVFEHLPSPTKSLTHAVDYLASGGLLIVSTGDCCHWTWRWLRGDHWYLDPIQHVRFASRKYFRCFAREHGLAVVEMKSISHHRAVWNERWREAASTIFHGGMRSSSRWKRLTAKLIAKLVKAFPGRHSPLPPYTQQLADHLFVVLRKH